MRLNCSKIPPSFSIGNPLSVLVGLRCEEGKCHCPEEFGDMLAHSWNWQIETPNIPFLRFDKNVLVVGENEVVPEPAPQDLVGVLEMDVIEEQLHRFIKLLPACLVSVLCN
jgi:hypothetical protein